MKKSRMGSNPLDRKKPTPKKERLEWIRDSRQEDTPDGPDTTARGQKEIKSEDTIAPVQSKQAAILSGGGATGAFEVGVLKALIKGMSPATGNQPLSFDIVTGTSVGAFNAA